MARKQRKSVADILDTPATKQSREEMLGYISVARQPRMYAYSIADILGEGVSPDGIAKGLRDISNEIKSGNTEHLEELLLLQLELLNQVFTRNIGKMNGSEHMKGDQIYSDIALKAQNQCRRTITALADLKNPKRTTFIKNSAVNQQVNLGETSCIPGEDPKKLEKNQTDELMGDINERMDAGATPEAVRSNQAVEALGEVHRAKECLRKGQGSPE